MLPSMLDSFHLLDPSRKFKAAFLHVPDEALKILPLDTILTSVSRQIAPFLRIP